MGELYKERVELHCHSCMSRADSVIGLEDIFNFAKEQNMTAVTITDYNSIQSFAKVQRIQGHKYKDIKPIYGLECLVVEDEFPNLVSSNVRVDDLPAFHVSILAKNMEGCQNLFRIITHINRTGTDSCHSISWSMLRSFRTGLLIGSACSAGELQNSIIKGVENNVLEQIADRYDYLEIQPVENDMWLLECERAVNISTREDLREIAHRVIDMGMKRGIPVVATSDARYLRSEDKLSRDVLLAGLKRDDSGKDELYVRTTDEMLTCFSYLGSEKAFEIVVDNTNRIAEQIEYFNPVPNKKYIPIYDDSDRKLRTIVEKTIGMKYPEEQNISERAVQRVNKELNRIEKFGWAPLFLHCYSLIRDNELSPAQFSMRGMVGGSYVAYLLGLVKSDPLSDELPLYDEMFMGFFGEKEPDMVFNIARNVRKKVIYSIPALTGVGKVLEGTWRFTATERNVAQWISAYEDKFNKKLSENQKEKVHRDCSRVLLKQLSMGKDYIIIPEWTEPMDMFPLSRDVSASMDLTYYDYYDISHCFWRYEILTLSCCDFVSGMEKEKGYYPTDEQIMNRDFIAKAVSILAADSAKGLRLRDHIGENREDFVQILKISEPKSFADYVRVFCLTHGTGAWKENAELLIKNEGFELKDTISCWEDVYEKLQEYGFDKKEAYTISEYVSKGKLSSDTEEYAIAMRKQDMPEWVINSCISIQYLFSRAHASECVHVQLRAIYYLLQ